MAETIYSLDGPTDRTAELPAEWFAVAVNRNAMYQAVRAQRTNQRAGTASTLGRSEVRGGGAKPWRQKGTGRARVGSIRSPLWEGGGVIHGPKPKSWSERLPRRVRQLAFVSALTDRAREGRVRLVVLDGFDAPKTARMAKALERWEVEGKVLLLTADHDANVALSGRNIPRLTVKQFRDASALDVLDHDVVVVEDGAWSTRPTPGGREAVPTPAEGGQDG